MTTTNAESAGMLLLGDEPYRGHDDALGFREAAKQLATLVRASRESTPLSLGIQAPWGMGKSTLMSMLRDELESDPGTRVVWFNPWTFEGQDVLEGLVKLVLEAVAPGAVRRALRKKRLLSLARLWLVLLTSFNSRAAKLVDNFWDTVASHPRARNQVHEVLDQAMQEWRGRTGVSGGAPRHEHERLVVVFIDDLDRCSPPHVLKVFEAVKLYLDAPGVVFVIGFDSTVVSDAVLDERKFSKAIRGAQYLEKIIQIDYAIPRPTLDQGRALLAEYVNAAGVAHLVNQDAPEGSIIVQHTDRNPRRMKRFINRFILDQRLTDPRVVSLPDATAIKTLMLQLYFKEFAALFRDEASSDPITEFLAYAAARAELAALPEGVDPSPETAAVFDAYPPLARPMAGESANSALERLNQAVPEQFNELTRNRDFIALVQTFTAEERPLVRQRILGQQERLVEWSEEVEQQAAPLEVPAIPGGFRVLWVDDQPENNDTMIKRLMMSGVEVEMARDTDMALKYILSVSAPDLVVSDVGRGADPEAGFTMVEMFRGENLYRGPVAFFVGRVTGQRRSKAKELGATITSNPGELLREIEQIAGRKAASMAKTAKVDS